ncbi:MAG: uroporphyrinogen decarboxylase family protein [Candidatus Hodarchaeota archaeon]
MEMTPKERVICALNLDEPDRVPYCEANIDPVVAAPLLKHEPPKEFLGITYHRLVDEEVALSKFLRRDNISYRLRAPVFNEGPKGKDGRTFYGRGLIRSEKDLELLDFPDPYDDSLYIEAEEYAKKKGDFALCLSTRMGIQSTYMSMGLEEFFYALHDNPMLVEKVMNAYFEWTAVAVERICQLDFDFIWSSDDVAWKIGPLFSPKFFRDVVVPKMQKVAEKITIPWVHHSDGNILPLLDDFIDLGVKGIHPIEPTAMDINELKKNYGNKICLLGNIDLNTLSMGTPEQVDEEVKKRIREIGPGGGYIVSSGNSIAAYCKPENVIAMAEAIQKYGKYPISIV